MKMPGVEAEEFLVLDRVAEIKFMHAHGVAFGANAEQFALDGVEIVLRIEWLSEDLIERRSEPFAWTAPVGGCVLHAVGNPDVGDGGAAERLAHRRADLAAGLA